MSRPKERDARSVGRCACGHLELVERKLLRRKKPPRCSTCGWPLFPARVRRKRPVD